MSRGLWFSMNARTRRSLTLLWTALFLFSLALQSVQMATPTAVLAVHAEDLFEMDGNALDGAAAGDDWEAVFDGDDSAFDTRFIVDPVNSDTDKTFTGGSTKDDINITSWLWKNAKASQAKNDITNAFAAAYINDDDETIAYFGLNKWEADGNNFVGFWFLKQDVGPIGSGNAPGSAFSGAHSVGDILVLASYTNGGSLADFDVYKWVGSGGDVNGTLETVASGVPCTGGLVDFACGATNSTTIDSPWPYQGRDGDPGEFPPGTLFRGRDQPDRTRTRHRLLQHVLRGDQVFAVRRCNPVRLRERPVLPLHPAGHRDPGQERPGPGRRHGHDQLRRVGH